MVNSKSTITSQLSHPSLTRNRAARWQPDHPPRTGRSINQRTISNGASTIKVFIKMSSQRQLSATIAKSIERMSVADASKTLRQGAVNLLDEYMRVAPTNQAVLITSTTFNTPGDITILLADGVPPHIAKDIREHAQKIEALLSQATPAPSCDAHAGVLPHAKQDALVKPQTSPDELHSTVVGVDPTEQPSCAVVPAVQVGGSTGVGALS